MKRKLLVLALLFAGGSAKAASVSYSDNFVNESALTYNTTYVMDLGGIATNSDYMTMQVVYSSANPSASTFTDGKPSTGIITVVSPGLLTSNKATDYITVPTADKFLTSAATNQFTISIVSTNSLVGTWVTANGNILLEGRDWTIGASSQTAATSIAAAINNITGLKAGTFKGIVFATATEVGTAYNSYYLTTSTPTCISTASYNFTGGRDNALLGSYVTVNGTQLNAGYEWLIADTSSGTATNLAAAIDALPNVDASASSRIVSATATVAGVAGNSYTLTASTVALSVSAATFSGGRDNAYVEINGFYLVQGTSWTAVSTASGCVKAISDAIVANPITSAIVTSTWTSGGVVKATSTVTGALTNYTLSVNTTALTVSGSRLANGTNSAINITTDKIYVPSHGLTTGFGVIYTTGTGSTPTPLVNNTTYYVIKVDSDYIQLATTSARSQQGLYTNITSSSTVGNPHSFTLTPQSYSGTPTLTWAYSNDGTNYINNPSASVLSVTATYPSATTSWDLGPSIYRYIRLSVVAPTTGGLNLNVIGYGRKL